MLACRCARTQSEEPDSGSYGLEKLALPGFASVLQDASACLARSHIHIARILSARLTLRRETLVPAAFKGGGLPGAGVERDGCRIAAPHEHTHL